MGLQCLLFVLVKRAEHFVLIPSKVAEENIYVYELFTQNSVQILRSNEEWPLLQEALERNEVEILDLVVTSSQEESLYNSTNVRAYTIPTESAPVIHVSVEPANEEFVKQLLGKHATVYRECYRNHRHQSLKSFDSGNSEIIERLLTYRNDIRCKSPPGETLLHLAVRRLNQKLVNLLLKHDVDVNIASADGSTALHLTVDRDSCTFWGFSPQECKLRCNNIASLLLKKGKAEVNARRNDGATSLLLVSSIEYALDRTLMFVKNGADVNIGNYAGWTPLHEAVKMGARRNITDRYVQALVSQLLEFGADINSAVTYGHAKGVTPLSIAVEHKCKYTVKYFLEKGADPNIPCYVPNTLPCYSPNKQCNGSDLPHYNGITILELAIDRECVGIVECLLLHNAGVSKLTRVFHHFMRLNYLKKKVFCKAVFEDNEARDLIAKLLFKNGFHLTLEKTEPLHDAICGNNYATVKHLLESGANVNKVYSYYNKFGCFVKTMPLITAVHHGANEIVKLLIKCGADAHAKLNVNDEDSSPLIEACCRGNIEAAIILLAENVKLSDKMKRDLLKLGFENNSPALLAECLRLSGTVCATHSELELSFQRFCGGITMELLEILIKFLFGIDSMDCEGNTALHFITTFGDPYPEVVKYLVQRNANIEAQNFAGETPVLRGARWHRQSFLIELWKYGANFDVISLVKGDSPLYIALYAEYGEIFETILHLHFTEPDFIQRADIYRFFRVSYIKNLFDCERSHLGFPLQSLYRRNKQPLQKNAQILAEHMIKLKAVFPSKELFDFCSATNLRSVSIGKYLMPLDKTDKRVWLDFQFECETEVARLKTQSIGDSSVSYYDVLTKSEEQVSLYLRNSVIFHTLESKYYETEFPIYAKILSYQFEKGSFRRKLLNESVKQCYLLSNFFNDLPLHLKEKVLSFFSIRDLEVTLHACRCISNCR